MILEGGRRGRPKMLFFFLFLSFWGHVWVEC
uniref:Uncharacterized protein n=1 Tax=Rhizophora mucronata TaxID=61149 RepID=A0A2P2NSR6_RHIMU